MLYLITAAALFGLSLCAPALPPASPTVACPFPNGTDKALHSYMCSNNEQFTINSIVVTDQQGNVIYPINPRVPFILNLDSYNNGPQIDDNKVNVRLFEYTTGWTGTQCAWSEIPTLGLLNNIDGCQFAHNCPLTHGPLTLQILLDLSQFSAIIDRLASYKPYEIEIRMYDYNTGSKHEEIACVMAQVELS